MKKLSNADRAKYGRMALTAGIACLVAALAFVAYNVIMDRRAGEFTASVMAQIRDDGEIDDADSADKDTDIKTNSSGAFIYQGYSFMGYLTIPRLGLELPVMSDWDYDRLSVSPCRYSGSALSGDLVIAAHNYDSHFGRLGQLEKGDEVRFTDMRGNSYLYQAALVDTLEATDISGMTSGEYPLSLFTCNLSGSARVTVRCVRKQ